MLKVGINGFGRMGRLALRAAWLRDDITFVAVNEPNASAETMALLLEFDSVQGRFDHTCKGSSSGLEINEHQITYTQYRSPSDINWKDLGVDLVLECSGAFRKTELLTPHLENGAKRVVVSAPVKDGPPNIVMGVNDGTLDLSNEPIVTAASCTTNALAPIVHVLNSTIGIKKGLITTIHDPTNTQSVHDAPHDDPRRARASQLSLIPTSTNSATAVGLIIPELAGKLDSIAVRAPVLNASLIDCVFHMTRQTSVEEINQVLQASTTAGPLKGILGYESRPLVSIDYAGDPRSSIVDAQSTRVTDGTLVKVLAWYDNEWGYANRMVELAAKIGKAL